MGYISAYQSAVLPPRRRAKKKPIPSSLRVQVFARDGHACLRCGCSVLMRLRADHVIPESKGGVASMDNLQTLCMSCNSWKGVQAIDFRVLAGGAA
ncbi:HNH endonuclease [Pseudomonas frederiksbergensis]|uniref:HNH endonuclease n=1 Tax=Pseudomonas frederiksbergensis TaxID=104087 RepID=UPI003D1A4AD5